MHNIADYVIVQYTHYIIITEIHSDLSCVQSFAQGCHQVTNWVCGVLYEVLHKLDYLQELNLISVITSSNGVRLSNVDSIMQFSNPG